MPPPYHRQGRPVDHHADRRSDHRLPKDCGDFPETGLAESSIKSNDLNIEDRLFDGMSGLVDWQYCYSSKKMLGHGRGGGKYLLGLA
jgi:hypothetical protein